MRVAIYARRSFADEGAGSVPVQIADCRDRAEEEGWEIVGEYADDGISAWDPRKVRPEYERLLQDAAAARFDAVLVREQERLIRQHKDAGRWLALFEETGFRRILCTLESDIDLRRARDQKDFRDRASQAEFYSAFLSEKVRRTTARKAANGEWSGGGRRPFGYRKVGPKPFRLEVDPREAEILRDAARRVLAGETIHSIVRLWNDGPDPVRKDSGARWLYKDVRRLLTSGHFAGLRGDVEAKWPAIIDRDTHEALVAMLLGQPGRDLADDHRQILRSWPLAGIVRCGECGQRMNGSAQERTRKSGEVVERRYYSCGVASGGCASVSIAAQYLERHVIEWALENAPDPGEDAGRAAAVPTADQSEALRTLRDLEERKRGLGGAYAEGLMTAAQVKEATVRLDADISRARAALTPVDSPRPTHAHLRRADAFWDFVEGRSAKLPQDEVEDLNAWLRWCVERVTVRKAKSKGARFDPARVRIEPRAAAVA